MEVEDTIYRPIDHVINQICLVFQANRKTDQVIFDGLVEGGASDEQPSLARTRLAGCMTSVSAAPRLTAT